MSLIVQKYGGTSVGSVERIKHVADKVIAARQAGHDVVVVVSAMAGETDKLERLAYDLTESPNPPDFDVLLATGEQVSIALLSIALNAKGCPARTYTGHQVQIRTDGVHNKARIVEIDDVRIRRSLAEGKVVVVAGFQGVAINGDITTLGRGGSDTTAVGLAAALKAQECQIYTDVDGVYTSDPRVVPKARLMPLVTFEEMLELASLGSKVLQIRAVEFAGKYNIPLRVLSTFEDGPGTLITYEDEEMERPVVTGIAFNRQEAKFTVRGVPDVPGMASKILTPVSDANIVVDMIIQNWSSDGTTDFTFTVGRRDFKACKALLDVVVNEIGAKEVIGDDTIVKVSLVGVGMRSHAGIATRMFETLAQEGINIQLISTSEIKVSVILGEKYLELGVRTLHTAFGLDKEPKEEHE